MCVNTTGLGGRGGLWSEKTTVCRIFSCKRALFEACRPVALRDQPMETACAAASLQTGLASRLAAVLRAAPVSLTGTFDCYISGTEVQAEAQSISCAFTWLPSERKLVENTGLEPVTSWLQTRRSPS